MKNGLSARIRSFGMKRPAALLCLLLVLPVLCTCTSIRETRSVIDKEKLKRSLGWNKILFIELNKNQFDYAMKHRRNSIVENPRIPAKEKEALVQRLSGYTYVKGQYFDFIIQHELATLRSEGATTLSFVDAKGKNLIAAVEPFTVQVLWASDQGGGKFYETVWFIKTLKPLKKSDFSEDRLPLKFTVKFMENQMKEYTIF